MEFAEHLTTLLSEGRSLPATARRAGWETPVPACPGWTVRDLAAHLGETHRWATMIVGEARDEFPSREERAALGEAPPDDGLAEWLGDGVEALADTLARAEPTLSCVTILPGLPPRQFWARRQAHETLVHRLDVELAADGVLGRVEPDTAVDGIAELLEFLPVRTRRRGGLRSDPPRTIVVTCDDGPSWTARTGPDGLEVSAGVAAGSGSGGDAAGPAPDVRLRGPAAAVHAVLWNRAPWSTVVVEGEDAVLELWREGARI